MSADLAAPHSKPHFVVPPGACDCHMHIFGPAERYLPQPRGTYTPRPASLADYSKMAATIGLERVVFVQPSAYGTDNRCLLEAMKQVGPSARGIIGLDGTVNNAALQDMDRAGVRGVRLNLASRGFRDAQQIAAMIHAAADRVGPLGWHIQLFTDVTVVQALADTLKHAPVPVLFNHMALTAADSAIRKPAWRPYWTGLGRGAGPSSRVLSGLEEGRTSRMPVRSYAC
jgi:predicted TIM-barrel fold metal-dependent hydrolase